MFSAGETADVADLGDQQRGQERPEAGNLLQRLGDGTGLRALTDLPVESAQLLAQQIEPLQLPVHFPAVGRRQGHFFQERPPARSEGRTQRGASNLVFRRDLRMP